MKIGLALSSLNRWNCFFLLFFIIITFFSFLNIEQSYSPLKYNEYFGLDKLISYYAEFQIDFKNFLRNTLAFHEGYSAYSRYSFYVLLPQFVGVKLLGGLSYSNLYRVSVFFGLVSIVVLYLFLKKYWNYKVAFFSCFFYGCSPWFQELFRSSNYQGLSVFLAMVILFLSFRLMATKGTLQIVLAFILGVTIGIGYYYYAVLRVLILLGGLFIWRNQKNRFKIVLFYFLGIVLILSPGIYLKLQQGGVFFAGYETCLGDKNPWVSMAMRIFGTMRQIFAKNVVQGGPEGLAFHSRLLDPWLGFPFILGIWCFITKRRKGQNGLFNLFFLLLMMPILIMSHCQVRRLVLLIIPLYVYTGGGVSCIYTFLQKIKDFKSKKMGYFLQILFVFLVIFIGLKQLVYSKQYILENERTLGFLRVGQEIKRQNIQGELLVLKRDSSSLIYEIKDEVFIILENYKKYSTGELKIEAANFNEMKQRLLKGDVSSIFLVVTPFFEDDIVGNWIREKGFHIYQKAKVLTPPVLIVTRETKNPYFELLLIEGTKGK